MKLAAQFYIRGKLWKLKYKWGLKDKSGFVDGLIDQDEACIFLRKELPESERFEVFHREFIRAVLCESHVNLNPTQEEVICQAIEEAHRGAFTMRMKREK